MDLNIKDLVNEKVEEIKQAKTPLLFGVYESKIITFFEEVDKIKFVVNVMYKENEELENKENFYYTVSYKMDEKNSVYTIRKMVNLIKNWAIRSEDNKYKQALTESLKNCNNWLDIKKILNDNFSKNITYFKYYPKEIAGKIFKIKELY